MSSLRTRVAAVAAASLLPLGALLAAPSAALADDGQIRPVLPAGQIAGPVLAAEKLPPAEFIAKVAPGAQAGDAEYGVPASVTIAQAILETGWGASELAATHNNYFGMKCKGGDEGPWVAGCVDYDSPECDASGNCWTETSSFRRYATLENGFKDRGLFLSTSTRYAPAFAYTDDADQFIREIHKAGYATDPQYSNKIINLMTTYNLYQYNDDAAPAGKVFQTYGSGVNVRSAPRTSASVVGTLGGPTSVRVVCQVQGDTVTANGYTNAWWAKLATPYSGYMTNIYIDDPNSKLPGVPDC